jgi:hypothetical protein
VGLVGECIALAPVARGTKRELAAVPPHSAATAQTARLEVIHSGSGLVRRIVSSLPEAAARELPLLRVSASDCRP